MSFVSSPQVDIESVKKEIADGSESKLILLEGFPKEKADIESFNEHVSFFK